MPSASVNSRVAFRTFVQIQQRLALAHQDDVDSIGIGLKRVPPPRRRTPGPTISPARQISLQAKAAPSGRIRS